jgi:Glutathione S-transferase, C-terminal domain
LKSTTSKERPFVFNQLHPTSLDALIYGHLSLHLLPTMPDPVLRTTLVESHPSLAFYLHKCHEVFSKVNEGTVYGKQTPFWKGLLEGWGIDEGKQKKDLIGIGGLLGIIMIYALWHRQSL